MRIMHEWVNKMDMSEIEGDEINVEDIIRQIRKNIKERKRAAHNAYAKDMVGNPLHSSEASIGQDDLQQNLDYINSSWDLHADYYISTHRPILGRFLVLGRQFIHGEVRRYVDLLVRKQRDFNMHVVGTLNNHIKAVDDKIDVVDSKINLTVENRINEIITKINKDIEKKAWLSDLLDNTIKTNIATLQHMEKADNVMNYFLFEEKYRGSTENIKQSHEPLLKYFENCQNVLDIGSGRGEFLLLLKEINVRAKGVDVNEDMVHYCRKNGLEVIQDNALRYLQSLENKSLDGIFSGQLIEHLQPDELISFVKLSYDKLQYGTYFIAETINPLCVVAHRAFNMDLTHVKFIHPETMKFLLESVGFRDIEFLFFSPVPEEVKLKKLDVSDVTGEDRTKYDLINQNIDNLNQLLYGHQDYAVIGKK